MPFLTNILRMNFLPTFYRASAGLSKPEHGFARLLALATMLGALLSSPQTHAASEADEHSAHHPGASSTPLGPLPPPEQTPSPPAAGEQQGMQGMSEMMKGMPDMMGAGKKELYPSLMDLPDSVTDRRMEVERLAEERIYEGSVLLQDAHQRLSEAIRTGDHDAASLALQQSREGVARVDSGVAAHRLVREGRPPQDVAMQWFKQNMGLTPPASPAHGFWGLTWFHYLSMLTLLAFAITMIALYFFRSRRAAVLVGKLAGSPPSSPAPASPAGALPGQYPVPATAPVSQDIAPSRPNSWTGALLVGRIFQETPQVKTFRLIDPHGGKLPFNYLPGQFLTFTVTPHGQSIKRSYTISSSPSRRDYCEVTIRREELGAVSRYLHDQVHEGELLQVTAPSGKFTFAGEDGSSIVLIGGGVGVTPMMSVVRYLTDRTWFGDIYLIYGCKTDEDVIYREELEHLARRFPNLHLTLVAERAETARWPHVVGRISKQLITASVPEIVTRHIHLCGPKPMMEAVKSMLADLEVPAAQVETEVFVGKEMTRPAAPAANVPPADIGTVTFARSGKTAPLWPTKTVLEVAEEVGVSIDYSCRSGTCGQCKVKLLSGTVTMEVDDALEPADKAQNLILACQAKSSGTISVEA